MALEHALSDEELLPGAARGERSALEELFRRHRGLAFRVAHRHLGNETDALDAVQDGFVKALTHLTSFQGRSSFKTWLLRVVSNAALDLARKRTQRDGAVAFSPQDEPRVEPNPAINLEREELRNVLQQALDQLPEVQRQTFILHVEGELSYREVADALGISIGTVMSRLFYARQKLRALLEPWVSSP